MGNQLAAKEPSIQVYHSINESQVSQSDGDQLKAGSTSSRSRWSQRLSQLNCLSKLRVLNIRGNITRQSWGEHLKLIVKQKFFLYDWSTMLQTIALESKDQWKDEQNVKQVHRIAKQSIQEAENTLQSDVSAPKLEAMIDDVIDSTEILGESLQEFQNYPTKHSFGSYKNVSYLEKESEESKSSSKMKLELKNNEEIYLYIYQFHAMTRCIEDQLRDPQNALFKIRKKYLDYFLIRYNSIKFYNRQNFDLVLKDIKGFIDFYIDIIRIYYRLDDLPSSASGITFLTLENLQNFVVSVIFDNPQFNDYLMKMFDNLDSELQKSFRNNLKQLQNATPSQFGVSDQFCLDEKTLTYFKSNVKAGAKYAVPYQELFADFQSLSAIYSPTQKLKSLVKLSAQINQCVKSFYHAHGLQGLEKPYDVDHLISLLIYIISRSQVIDLYQQIKLIEHFTCRNSINSVSGYLLITLEGCFLHIAQQNIMGALQSTQLHQQENRGNEAYAQNQGSPPHQNQDSQDGNQNLQEIQLISMEHRSIDLQ